MRYSLSAMFVSAVVVLAQPSAILDDLESRALLALTNIPRAETWEAVHRSRNSLQVRLEQELGLQWAGSVRPVVAFVYAPKNTNAPAPGVILLRPHDDPAAREARSLPAVLAQLGMFVVELDARSHHSRLDLLGEGATPEGLMQEDVRCALAYLKARADVDPKRLALVGEGLVATIAVAINPDVSASVILNGAPDFALLMKGLRALTSNEPPDSCILVPGAFRYAASQELLSLIAPRPLLLMNAADEPL